MTYLRLLLILTLIFTYGCSQENNEISEGPIGGSGSIEVCTSPNVLSCETNFTRLAYTINCELCETDSRLADEKQIVIHSEALPSRVGMQFDTLIIGGGNYYCGEVCIPTIENQDSLVIGLYFFQEEINSNLRHAVYDKIKVNNNATTVYNKTITTADIWDKPPCTSYYATFSEVIDSSAAEFDVFAEVCNVGSPGDCITISTSNKNFYGEVEGAMEAVQYSPTSSPCGEVYFKID